MLVMVTVMMIMTAVVLLTTLLQARSSHPDCCVKAQRTATASFLIYQMDPWGSPSTIHDAQPKQVEVRKQQSRI